jgi:hypothetical protein
MLTGVPAKVVSTLRDDVVSLEGQVTLIATALTESLAASAEQAANRAAQTASGAVDGFERVFDMRVMDALARAGAPSAAMIRDLAERIAVLARDVARLSELLQPLAGKRYAEKQAVPAAKTRAKARKPGRAVRRAKAAA